MPNQELWIAGSRRRGTSTRFFERLIPQAAGGTPEGMAGQILLVARLLADEHAPCVRRAFTENGLRAALQRGHARQPAAASWRFSLHPRFYRTSVQLQVN